jgi:N-acetylmuramic acid 6-phosphate etherase
VHGRGARATKVRGACTSSATTDFSRRAYDVHIMNDRSHLLTEQRLPESMSLDAMSIEQAVALMNQQDAVAVEAAAKARPAVVKAIELVVAALKKGGRLFYLGAGTSGRLGILDASECPPTFRTEPEMVQGVIAGGIEAMFKAREGAEDSPEGAARDVDERDIGENDVVIGIAAGGTTPYVHGALRRAGRRRCSCHACRRCRTRRGWTWSSAP